MESNPAGAEVELAALNRLGDRVVKHWKNGSRAEADANLADLVRRVAKLQLGDHVFWRVVAECGLLNLGFADRPAGVDGAEILSAAWERLTLENISNFRGDSSVRTWLYMISKNVAADLARKERRHSSRAVDGDIDQRRPTGEFKGSSLLTFCHDLQIARTQLTDDEAELLDLWLEHGDRSGAAIARELGEQERTIRYRLDRLFKQLGLLMDDPRRNRNVSCG